ncbi:failed axon connections [Aedes albopictus]|uniref:Failed axon connections fax protein/glutathione s-transferase-like protein n=1 Tax=Aedes albopictus TaxID=7160 RepID=A0ABM1XLW4_AEDAL
MGWNTEMGCTATKVAPNPLECLGMDDRLFRVFPSTIQPMFNLTIVHSYGADCRRHGTDSSEETLQCAELDEIAKEENVKIAMKEQMEFEDVEMPVRLRRGLSEMQVVDINLSVDAAEKALRIGKVDIDTDGVNNVSVQPNNHLLTLPFFLALLLPSQNVDHKLKLRSKKGQLPFVEVNGEEIADSAIIIKELAQRYEKDLDAALTQEQRNIAHAMISMLENHLIWVLLFWRSKNPDQMIKGYKVNLQHALGSRLPNAVLNFLFKFQFGRKGAKKVKAQGLGVHKPEEIEEFGKQDLKVLSELLADKPFFFGDEPTTLDCVAFSVLAQVHYISDEVKYALKEYMQENCPNLVGHVSRIKERCFPDWDDICTKLDLNAHLPKPEPETKENKEGADTEKTAEQDKNESEKELEKDNTNEKTEKKEEKPEKAAVEENKEKEEAAAK